LKRNPPQDKEDQRGHLGFLALLTTFFVNWPIRNKKCLYQPYFLSNQNEMRIFVEVLLNIILVKFGSNWHSSFRADFFSWCKNKIRKCCGRMFSFKTTVAVGTKLYRNGV
jgi:hypothetical protein